MRPLRIAQVCADRGIAPGSTKGAAQHLRGIAAGLSSGGHEVTTFTARVAEGSFPTPVLPLDQLAAAMPSVDVVYERASLGHREGLELARAVGVPFVLEVNAPLVDEANRHRPGSVGSDDAETERMLLAEADLVVTVSSELAAWADAHRAGPTIFLPNGFEPSWFRRERRSGSRRLVFLGHPKPWHGADRLPGLLSRLDERGCVAELLVIGGGPGAEAVLDDARWRGLESRVTVTGALPPAVASELLSDCAVGLAPYPGQTGFYFCPLKVIDYLAAGLPIVSTRQGDIPELVGEAGVVVDPDDDDALVDAVAWLLEHPTEAEAMGATGRERAHASMTWHAIAAATAEAMTELLVVGGSR